MAEIISTELKSDLENIYKITGDLINLIDSKNFEQHDREAHDVMEVIKFRLMDIGGTLQKDIFNCDYVITKFRTVKIDE